MMTGWRQMTMAHGSSNFLFILLCGLWYSTSALSSNTGKAILNQFRYPIYKDANANQSNSTEYFFLWVCSKLEVFFFSSIAISRIPVSTVHTFFFFSNSRPNSYLILLIRHYLLYLPLRPKHSSSE